MTTSSVRHSRSRRWPCEPRAVLLALLPQSLLLGLQSRTPLAADPSAEDLVAAVVRCSEAVKIPSNGPARGQVLQASLDELARAALGAQPDTTDALLLYEAICQTELGQRARALETVAAALAKGVDRPDFLKLKARLQGAGDTERAREARLATWDVLGQLLPVSVYGHRRDYELSGRLPKVDRPPRVPRLDWSALLAIAESFRAMGLMSEAVHAYRETFYTFADPGGPVAQSKSQVWLSMADALRASGEPREAARAYLRAVYYDKGSQLQATQGLSACLAEDTAQQDTIIEPTIEAEKLESIASLYAQVNMHPRAVWVLTLGGEELDAELAPLRAGYEREWSERLKEYCAIWEALALRKGPVYLFGQEVMPETRASDLRIPWPCGALTMAEG